jgi:hypothetical protein
MRFFPLVLALILFQGVYADEAVDMRVVLGEDGSAHITISTTPISGEGLEALLREPGVKDIYRDRFSQVFPGVVNLDLRVEGESMVVEFDAHLARGKDTVTTIPVDFAGIITSVSTLVVILPKDMRLVSAEPPPSEQVGRTLTWRDVSSIPRITYKTQTNPTKAVLVTGGILILLLFLLRRRMTR